MELAPSILTLMALVLFLGGAMKGATGVGLPIIAVPVLAIYLPLPLAIAVIVVPGLVTNGWQMWRHRSDRPSRETMMSIPLGTTVGTAVGVWLLASLPARYLDLGVALAVGIFLASRLARPDWRVSEELGRRLAPPAMFFTGLTQAATGISGPVVVMYWSSLGLSREAFIFGVSLVFFVAGVLQWIGMVIAGLFGWHELWLSLLAVAPSTLGIPFGEWLARRLNMVWFNRIILATLAVMAVQLVLSALPA
ncbi:sulfite exporter TauE/SafE family protein [Histidinibacterium aquaticum]|uniref:Probable membrane transporter protein n=1 Tax=Histidinibacterium aquaticum TaxID=2613962 RepID=A0A5J5GE28_9RHOB|nr:sulfite exporter TauE/SafE family protein [Histidinibacterium aquaticum]KAA9005734.1 sulfite exporter TauE/SafE family protein [Histidinibacterium aquaticum]